MSSIVESSVRVNASVLTPGCFWIPKMTAGKALWDIYKHGSGLRALITMQFVVGVTLSGLTGCVVIAWFLHYLRRGGMRPFVYYRIVFGIIVIALAASRPPAG